MKICKHRDKVIKDVVNTIKILHLTRVEISRLRNTCIHKEIIEDSLDSLISIQTQLALQLGLIMCNRTHKTQLY